MNTKIQVGLEINNILIDSFTVQKQFFLNIQNVLHLTDIPQQDKITVTDLSRVVLKNMRITVKQIFHNCHFEAFVCNMQRY